MRKVKRRARIIWMSFVKLRIRIGGIMGVKEKIKNGSKWGLMVYCGL